MNWTIAATDIATIAVPLVAFLALFGSSMFRISASSDAAIETAMSELRDKVLAAAGEDAAAARANLGFETQRFAPATAITPPAHLAPPSQDIAASGRSGAAQRKRPKPKHKPKRAVPRKASRGRKKKGG